MTDGDIYNRWKRVNEIQKITEKIQKQKWARVRQLPKIRQVLRIRECIWMELYLKS
jgi:hypothetical protein